MCVYTYIHIYFQILFHNLYNISPSWLTWRITLSESSVTSTGLENLSEAFKQVSSTEYEFGHVSDVREDT